MARSSLFYYYSFWWRGEKGKGTSEGLSCDRVGEIWGCSEVSFFGSLR